MKNGRIFLILIGVIIFVLVVITIISSFFKKEEDVSQSENEITPREEITEEQERQTIVSLYYMNEESNSLVPEARVIDAKNLLENPYKTLTEYLIEGPKNEKLKKTLPEGTKVNNASISGDIVILDLSSEFIRKSE
ncbi:MAG: GerMN domain-containing protein [Clostridia bacterium]|nr:GerMN domain-containing protein [Clostridia bacterium]